MPASIMSSAIISLNPATGEIVSSDMLPWVCGRCGYPPVHCSCPAETTGHMQNYVVKDLPPPQPNSPPIMLLNRWASVVDKSVHLPRVRGWLAENDGGGSRLNKLALAMENDTCRAQLLEMVQEYSRNLSNERLYRSGGLFTLLAPMWMCIHPTPVVDKVSYWKSREDVKMEIIRGVLLSSALAFLAGDWTCITRVGALLLAECFPLREEWPNHRYMKNNIVGVQDLGDAAIFLTNLMGAGYTEKGGGAVLAIEDSSDGSCPPRWHEWYGALVAREIGYCSRRISLGIGYQVTIPVARSEPPRTAHFHPICRISSVLLCLVAYPSVSISARHCLFDRS